MRKAKGGLRLIVVLVIVILLVIFGGLLIVFTLNGTSANDVNGTALEGVGQITETGVNIAVTIMPLIVWLLVAAVLIVALVFVYKAMRRKR